MATADQLLDRVLASHQAALDAVHSVEFVLEREIENPVQLVEVKYWRRGSSIRISEKDRENPQVREGLSKDGIALRLSGSMPTDAKNSAWGADREAGYDISFSCHVQHELLLGFERLPKLAVPLKEFLSQNYTRLETSSQAIGGKELYVINFSIPMPVVKNSDVQWHYQLTVDAALGLVSKRMAYPHDQFDNRGEREITKFAEPIPGVFFPVESRFHQYANGRIASTMYSRVRDLKINQPISESTFTLQIPTGAFVNDKLLGRSYYMGQNEWTALPPGPQVFGGATIAGGGEGPTAWNDVQAAAAGNNFWWYFAAVFFALVAIVLFLRHRQRYLAGA